MDIACAIGFLLLYLQILQIGCQNDLPTIQPFQFAKSVKSGMKASVTCLVISTSKSVKFQWLKDGKDIYPTSEIRIKEDVDFSTIIVYPVHFNSSGNYTCIARNDIGSHSFSAFLKIEASPSWIKEPQDVKVHMANPLKLDCEASGYPVPVILWKKIQRRIEKSEGEKSLVDNWKNSSLIINNVSVDDAGTYECEASNGVAPNIKKNILLTVIGKVAFRLKNLPKDKRIFIPY